MKAPGAHGVRLYGDVAEIDFFGAMSVQEVEGMLLRAEALPGRRQGTPLLIMALAPQWDPAATDLREAVAVIRRYADAFGGRIAVVVGAPLYYGLTRMAGAFAEGEAFALRPFQDVADAVDWLHAAS